MKSKVILTENIQSGTGKVPEVYTYEFESTMDLTNFKKENLLILGTRVKKKSGSEWQGRIVGWYSTKLTPLGFAVESDSHAGSVQIYPATALEVINDNSIRR